MLIASPDSASDPLRYITFKDVSDVTKKTKEKENLINKRQELFKKNLENFKKSEN